jgi:hypothetical protein
MQRLGDQGGSARLCEVLSKLGELFSLRVGDVDTVSGDT